MRDKVKGIGTTVYARVLTSFCRMSRLVGANMTNSLSTRVGVKSVIMSASTMRRSVSIDTLKSPIKRIPHVSMFTFPTSGRLIEGTIRTGGGTGSSVHAFAKEITDKSRFVSRGRMGRHVIGGFNTGYTRVRKTTVTRNTCLGRIPYIVVHTVSSGTSKDTRISCPAFRGRTVIRNIGLVGRLLPALWSFVMIVFA